MLLFTSCQNNSTENTTEKVYKTIITKHSNINISEIQNILEANNISYKINDELSAIQVTDDEYYNSIFLLGKAGYTTDMFILDNANISTNGTALEREEAFTKYITDNIKLVLNKSVSAEVSDIQIFNVYASATINSCNPYTKIILSSKSNCNYSDICEFVSAAMGSESATNIIITDTNNTLIFGDEEVYEIIKQLSKTAGS